MKYNELLEMTIENWNGKPFEAYVTDYPLNDFNPDASTTKITGWNKDRWIDDISKLLHRIEELEAKQPKWISVKDRLPPNDYAFVVACDSKGENDITGVWYDCDTNRWDNGVYSFPFETFTHWMPLPEAPRSK